MTPPLILLSGDEGPLSIARTMVPRSVRVLVATHADASVYWSRVPFERHPCPPGVPIVEHFRRLLLEHPVPGLEGAVILACGDHAIEFIAAHEEALRARYLLDCHQATLRTALLDKAQTIELARAAGIGAPAYLPATSLEAVAARADSLKYPVLVKPVHSHLFQQHYRVKLLVANDPGELLSQVRETLDLGLEMIVTEWIPGPDSLLSSYYTHLDDAGEPLFHYTKRVIRRCDVNFGGGCYHESRWLADTAAAGERFFRAIGLTGLGNVEFKRDPRDGELKLIECNARITAANQVIVASGLDIAWLIYRRLQGLPVPPAEPAAYQDGVTLWYPLKDFDSFRQLRERGELGLDRWLATVARRHTFPYLTLGDPAPSVHRLAVDLGARAMKRARNAVSWARA